MKCRSTLMKYKLRLKSTVVKALGAGLFCTSFSSLAMAGNQPDFGGWSWSADLGNMKIDSKVAAREGIDENVTVLGFAGEHYTSNSDLRFALGIDVLLYDDKAAFSQDTTDGRKKSDASGGLAYIEFGPHYRFGADGMSFFVAKLGASAMLSSSRSISYCRNCDSENIDVNGGLYGVLGIGRSFGSFDLSLNVQQYFSGDIDNSIGIKLSTSF